MSSEAPMEAKLCRRGDLGGSWCQRTEKNRLAKNKHTDKAPAETPL